MSADGIAGKRRGLDTAAVLALISSSGLGLTSSAPANSSNAAAVGVATDAARADHSHRHTLKTVYSTGGNQAMVPSDIGAMGAGIPATSLAATPPAFGALTTVGAGLAIGRWVFGTFEALPTAGNAALVSASVETGVATGIYSEVQRLRMPAMAVPHSVEAAFAFFVPPGRRYQFIQGALAGTTELIQKYSFHDV